MNWVSLNTRHLREASYDAARQHLTIRTGSGTVRRHEGVLQHVFDNLVSTDDKDFYYRYYVEPSLVSDRYGFAAMIRRAVKIGALGAAVFFLSASGLLA